jgi:hypothetical protein
MALVLNTNSYVTAVEADTYFDTRIDSANWFAAAIEIQEQALVTATQLVDDHAWIGSAVSSTQALAWPRSSAIYFDDRLGTQISVAEDEIPSRVKVSVYEQALHLINNEDLLAGTTQTFESISVGSISLTDSNGDVNRTSIKPSVVMKSIRPLIRKGSGGVGATWWRAN